MSVPKIAWALGMAVLALAVVAAIAVALALPLGYDSRAYWLAAQHLVGGERIYALPDATLGTPDEFHYLPIVALPFVALLPFSIGDAVRIFLVLQLVLAVLVGYMLIRPLPLSARPWAAAAYAFFLPMVLEVTLGNVDLISLALALLAWHWRASLNRSALALAAAEGLKFLPAILLPFYLAAGRGRSVLRAFLIGVTALVVTLPFLWKHTLDYVELLPRYADPGWARIHLDREEPAYLAGIFWSDLFPIVLALAALACGVACGRMALRDPSRETEWHHIALALAPYLAPFGFFWTTFLITSLPLFAITLRRVLVLPVLPRVIVLGGLLMSFLLMQLVQVHDLWVPVYHAGGVILLIGITLALMAREPHQRDQALGRSTPRSRATSSASG